MKISQIEISSIQERTVERGTHAGCSPGGGVPVAQDNTRETFIALGAAAFVDPRREACS